MIKNDEFIILIVDDNVENIKILGISLKNSGYELIIAQNGYEALECIKEVKPDLILLDIMMPGINGYDVCKILKNDVSTKDIPIIFLTAKTQIEDIVKGFEVGGVDYITKPFIKEELLARVKIHLELKKAIEELKKVSVTDTLTGVFNRRFAYSLLHEQIENAKLKKQNFSICFIDIDNLKLVNDSFGHKEGDKLLLTIVNLLKENNKLSNYICRMGGDEFIIIFPNNKLENCTKIIDTVECILKDKKIENVPISFSKGFAEYRFDMDIAIDKLIEIADKNMYKEKIAKKQKNKSSFYSRGNRYNAR
jgi:diguanylate cyclase (GGDEF)-like protein